MLTQILRSVFFITHQSWEPPPEEVPEPILISVNALQQISLPHVPFFRFLYPFTGVAEVQDTLVEQHLCIPPLYAFAKKKYLVFWHEYYIWFLSPVYTELVEVKLLRSVKSHTLSRRHITPLPMHIVQPDGSTMCLCLPRSLILIHVLILFRYFKKFCKLLHSFRFQSSGII